MEAVKRIYADHAATTKLCEAAFKAMLPFLRDEFGNPSSLHSWAKEPRSAINVAREKIAQCINAEPEEILFTSGGTEANNWAIKSTGGTLYVSSYEHHSVLNSANSEAVRGRELVIIKPKMGGYIMPRNLSVLKSGTGLVSIMSANNEIGTTNPVRLLSETAHDKGYLFHTDAVQMLGHLKVDVKDWGVDYLSASAHKFNGPKGIGFLYCRKGAPLQSFLDGGSQESGLRAGTENVAAIVGMAAALEFNCSQIARQSFRLERLAASLCDGISRIKKDAHFPGRDIMPQLPGFVSVSFPGCSAESLLHLLDLKGVAVSAGAACNSRKVKTSHVLKAIHLPRKLAESTIRISLGYENTDDDVSAIIDALKFALKHNAT